MSFVEQLRKLGIRDLIEMVENIGELEEEERRRQEEEIREQEEWIRMEEQVRKLVPFVIEKVNPYLEIINREYLDGCGEINSWRDFYRYEPKIVSELEWDVRWRKGGISGKRFRLVTRPDYTIEVFAGRMYRGLGARPTGLIDTNEENWGKQLEEAIISKLTSKEAVF